MTNDPKTTTDAERPLERDFRARPCHFCGGRDIQFKGAHEGITFVMCGTCHAITSFGGRERMNDTRRAWNGQAS